jgi:hypothetical protein
MAGKGMEGRMVMEVVMGEEGEVMQMVEVRLVVAVIEGERMVVEIEEVGNVGVEVMAEEERVA